MAKKTKLSIDLGLSNIKIKTVTIDSAGDYHIYVSCTANSTLCHKCGKKIVHSHGQCDESIIEHLSILDRRVFIHVKWPRFKCSNCDNKPITTSFRPQWLNETGEQTIAYENFCLKLLVNSTVKDTALKLSTTEDVVEGVINRRISTDVNWDQISPERIGIDEIALRKGHSQYLTIISDISIPQKIKILAVINGRSKDEIMPFLKTIPNDILLSLESITIDMGASYYSALKEVINDIKIFNRIVTIDRFHVAKLLGGKIDKERKKIVKLLQKEFKEDEEKLEQLKDTMWPFRHHVGNLNEDDKRLENLFKLAPALKECYELREALYQIFEKKEISREKAKEEINEWCKKAEKYETKGFNPFTSFIKTYKKYEENIVNYFIHNISSGPVEGLNNKIKVIKRRGFGFRNITNFAKRLFLDINYKNIFLPATS